MNYSVGKRTAVRTDLISVRSTESAFEKQVNMKTQVLIVGAGPVGMTAASELARYGVSVRIVDKAPHRTDKSKALVLWSRTLELLDRGPGGAAPFIEDGFKAHAVNLFAGDGQVRPTSGWIR